MHHGFVLSDLLDLNIILVKMLIDESYSLAQLLLALSDKEAQEANILKKPYIRIKYFEHYFLKYCPAWDTIVRMNV